MIKTISQNLRNIGGKYIFLIAVVVLYAGVLAVKSSVAKDAFGIFLALFVKILPIFALVLAFMFLLNLFLEPKIIVKYIGKSAGAKGWAISVVGGILSSGPIYMWYPLLGDLKEKGARNSFIAAFLYNRAVKIPLLPLMIYYFGLPFVFILTSYMIIFSFINGVVVGKLVDTP